MLSTLSLQEEYNYCNFAICIYFSYSLQYEFNHTYYAATILCIL